MRRSAAALAAAAVLLAGCGGGHGRAGTPASGGQGSPKAATPEGRITALLARRAHALEAGSVRRYAATATGAQRARDRRDARNASGLPLRAVRLQPAKIAVKGRTATLDVRQSYAVPGIAGRFEVTRTMRAVRTRQGWRVRSVASRRQRNPWEVGPFTASRTRHFLVFAPRGLDTGDLPSTLESGYARMRDVLAKGRLKPRYLVVVAGDDRQARQMTAGIRGVATLAAISDAAVREEGPAERVARVSSQRLLVVWPAFVPLDPEGRLRVVAHELTHAALSSSTSGRTPSWLVEGVALWVSGDRRVDQAAQLVTGPSLSAASRRALTLTGLSSPDAIARLGGDGQTAAYAYSSSAAFYLIERYGRARFFRLYDAFNRTKLAGRPGPALVDRALRSTLGTGLLPLERALRRWILTTALAP